MSDPFIGRDDLGHKLNLDLSADDHALACVDAACEVCRTISEQTFNRGTADVTRLDGPGTEVLLLPQYPVNDVGEVKEDGETLDSGDYVLNDATGGLVRVPSNGFVSSNYTTRPTVVWNLGKQNIEVTYDHGYDLEDVPRDVRMVALTVAARLYEQGSASYEQLGARSVRYESAAADLSDNELRILHKHKRVR